MNTVQTAVTTVSPSSTDLSLIIFLNFHLDKIMN